ncbi:MAG: hypothetical protein WBK88_09555, partial [Methanothrix sp.]
GLVAGFGREFVETGLIEAHFGRTLRIAEELRSEADYSIIRLIYDSQNFNHYRSIELAPAQTSPGRRTGGREDGREGGMMGGRDGPPTALPHPGHATSPDLFQQQPFYPMPCTALWLLKRRDRRREPRG